ncbi:hypothetical protein BOPS111487_21035 [Bordetella pseudohinzii]
MPAAPTLPQQALDIAAQAAEVQARVAAAHAAPSTPAAVRTAAADAAPAEPETALPAAAQAAATDVAKTATPAAAMPAPHAQARVAQAASREPAAPLPAAQTPAGAAAQPPLPHPDLPATQEEHPAVEHAAASVAAPAAEPLTVLTPSTPRQAATADIAPAAPSLQVNTPVGATQWGQELSRQVLSFSQNLAQGSHTAELRLDPPDLGPLRVTLSLNDGVASASFVSAHAAVRQAVESALPQLHQALSQAGISLGQTHVGDQGQQAMGGQPQGQSSGHAPGGQRQDGAYAQGSPQGGTAEAPRAQAHDGLVNTYA